VGSDCAGWSLPEKERLGRLLNKMICNALNLVRVFAFLFAS
jgi:hypothetical protein